MLTATQMHDQLTHPTRLWSRPNILARPCPVPAEPGVYAWYFAEVPPGVPTQGCAVRDGCTLLYVGISPSAPPANGKPPSRQNLRTRVRYHMRGNAEGSTLRLSLGCLLSARLGIELRRVGSGGRRTFARGEARLSAWLERSARVTWVVHPQPWAVEPALIATLVLALNLDQNGHSPFHATLSRLRAEAKQRARMLPIV